MKDLFSLFWFLPLIEFSNLKKSPNSVCNNYSLLLVYSSRLSLKLETSRESKLKLYKRRSARAICNHGPTCHAPAQARPGMWLIWRPHLNPTPRYANAKSLCLQARRPTHPAIGHEKTVNVSRCRKLSHNVDLWKLWLSWRWKLRRWIIYTIAVIIAEVKDGLLHASLFVMIAA